MGTARLTAWSASAICYPGPPASTAWKTSWTRPNAAAAWDRIVADRVPAAVGACRLIGLGQGVATIEIDMPIVAQEIRLRSPELLAALRAVARTPIRQLHVTARHV